MADCCTANNGQGWPKFALRVVFRTPADDGVAIGAFAPVRANLTGGGTLLLNTQYPFEDRVEVLLRATKTTPLRVRVPTWATTALAWYNGTPVPAHNGTMLRVNCTSSALCNVTLDLRPVVRVENGWYGSAVAVMRGSLLFSAKLRQDFIEYKVGNVSACSNQPYNQGIGTGVGQTSCGLGPGEKPRPAKWFGVNNTNSSFNWALVLRRGEPVGTLSRQASVCASSVPRDWPLCAMAAHGGCGLHEVACTPPFAYATCSMEMSTRAQQVHGWKMKTEIEAFPPPASPACNRSACGPPQNITLVPHGCTAIRVGTFPVA